MVWKALLVCFPSKSKSEPPARGANGGGALGIEPANTQRQPRPHTRQWLELAGGGEDSDGSDGDVFEDALEDAFEIEFSPLETVAELPPLQVPGKEEEGAEVAKGAPGRGLLDCTPERMDALLQSLDEALNDNAGYVVSRRHHPTVLYRHRSNARVHSLKYEAVFPYGTDELVCMGREVALLPTWNAYVVEPAVLEEVGELELAVYCAIWMPWPFREREMVLYVYGTDLLASQGCYVINLHDLEHEGIPLERYGSELAGLKRQRRERLAIMPGSCIIVYPHKRDEENPMACGDVSNRLLVSVHADPLLMAPPVWLVSFVLKVMAPTMTRALEKALHKTFGGKAEQDNPHVSSLSKRRLYSILRHRDKEMLS